MRNLFNLICRHRVLAGLAAIVAASAIGAIGNAAKSNGPRHGVSPTSSIVVGHWVREFAYNSSASQYDEYRFYADGTFDHHSVITSLNVSTDTSGRWEIADGSVRCGATGYRDELLIVDGGLLQLSNRARGIPAYRRAK